MSADTPAVQATPAAEKPLANGNGDVNDKELNKVEIMDEKGEKFQLQDEDLEKASEEESLEDSPIEEVRAAVPPTDNPDLPTGTFRAWVLGILFTLALAFTNQFFWFRENPLLIKVIVVQLLAYPFGKFMAHVVPAWKIRFFGREVSLNPGPFNVKEHVLIAIMASTASVNYDSIDIIVVQKLYYNVDIGWGGLLLVLSIQTLGYGFAGFLRRFLVRPASMIWPINLVNSALFHSLHRELPPDVKKKAGRKSISRNQFFTMVLIGSFFYYWFPGYIMPLLTSISWLCWTNRDSILVSQLGSGLNGLGFLSFSLDWSSLVAWVQVSPLAIPWPIIANMLAGFVFFIWIVIPAVYYTNTFESQKFPIYNTKIYDIYGNIFDRDRVLSDNLLNETAYNEYSPVRITGFFAICYGQGLAALGAILMHSILYNGKEIWARLKSAKSADDDIHARLMDRYKEVPDWWYFILFLVAFALSMVTITQWKSDMPWWTLLVAIVLAVIWVIPMGILTAITGQAPTISMITEWVFGVIMPGAPIGNMMFKTYGYIAVKQALLFAQDLKLGHYMKIPPRDMFAFQIVGTVIASFVSFGTTKYLMDVIPNICTQEAYPWTCPNAGLFGASSVVWGVVGPLKFFYPGTTYNPIAWFFLAGFLLPVPFWLAYKRWPNSWLRHVNIAAVMLGAGPYPPAPTNVLPTWSAVGLFFNFYVKKRWNGWWAKYNYILSSGLDAGVAIAAVVIFFALQNNNIHFPAWWGNNVASIDQCPLALVNATGVLPQKYPAIH
ncbi:uncharacterized protein VTP21DRAFT_34 [Calcarisporiella thermophila]|uniref:uncharacterized protein n=1 Tax=Calcarisporiella thermophila TaxID=911321 RepID=UPI0037444E9F